MPAAAVPGPIVKMISVVMVTVRAVNTTSVTVAAAVVVSMTNVPMAAIRTVIVTGVSLRAAMAIGITRITPTTSTASTSAIITRAVINPGITGGMAGIPTTTMKMTTVMTSC